MSETQSTMLPLGTKAPNFTLPDPAGEKHSLADFRDSKAFLVMFICNHCPFVKHVREKIVQIAETYQKKGVAVFAVNPNDAEKYPDDSPEKMKETAEQLGFTFPYLVDADQKVAREYKAACTPDFYVFNRDLELVYRGQMDDSRPGNDKPVTGDDLTRALDRVLAGKPAPEKQKPSIGCNIKWKSGNEPEYFKG